MAEIQLLSRPVSTTIRSSVILPNISQIFSELLQNSLDADSTVVSCHIDLNKRNESLRIEDDGFGITREGLSKIGKRFRTSKGVHEDGLGPVNFYGFRGEALASIAALSLLEITTKEKSSQVLCKVIRNSKILYEGRHPNGHIAGEHGTTVVVKDIFCNLPVRREELANTSATVLMGQLRRVVETLSLGNPHVKWAVWEKRSEATGEMKKIISINQSSSALSVFNTLYGSALVRHVQNVRVTSGDRRVDGFISVYGDISKTHQYLFINGHHIDRGDLHELIARQFAKSKFTIFALSGEHEEAGYTASKRSPRRLERHPVYVLNVTLPFSELDMSYEPKKRTVGYKHMEFLKTILLAIVNEFLKRNGYSSDHSVSLTPSFKNRSFCRASLPITRPGSTLAKTSLLKTSLSHSRPLYRDISASAVSRRVLTKPFEPNSFQQSLYSTVRSQIPNIPSMNESSTNKVKWTDGFACEKETGVFSLTHPNYPLSVEPKSVSNSRNRSLNQPDDTCHNCTYTSSPDNIQPLSLVTPASSTIPLQLTSLSNATVLGQVDKKYIAAIIDSTSFPALSLIDQHAADERVEVERILLELCEGFTQGNLKVHRTENTADSDGLMITLTRPEASVLSQPGVVPLFKRWGIDLRLPYDLLEMEYVQVKVHTVPNTFSSRLSKKEGIELTRLVKGYLSTIVDNAGEIDAFLRSLHVQDVARYKEEDKQDICHSGNWNNVVRFMPRELLELANSKACRGAIMFEDRLSRDQCSRLLEQLAGTKFPFTCAHGRPVMVPLLILKGYKKESKRRRFINWSKLKKEMEEYDQ
ncbi:hypothetical protein L204_102083 [Cryptococcus depauperatus]